MMHFCDTVPIVDELTTMLGKPNMFSFRNDFSLTFGSCADWFLEVIVEL